MTHFSYCPYCGNPLNNISTGVKKHYSCSQGHVLYLNSKPAVGALIVSSDQSVLLVRRRIEPYKGHWDIPGGFLDIGEHPIDGIHREIQEELGIPICINRFFGHFVGNYASSEDNVLSIFYIVTADVTHARPQDDIYDFKWFSLEKLPTNLSFPVNYSALQLLRNDYIVK